MTKPRKPAKPPRGIQLVQDSSGNWAYRVQVIRRGRTYLDQRYYLLRDAETARAQAIAAAADAASPDWVMRGTLKANRLTIAEAMRSMCDDQERNKLVALETTAPNDRLRAEWWIRYLGPTLRVDSLSADMLRAFLDETHRPHPDELADLTDDERKAALAGTKAAATQRQYLGIVSKTYKHLRKTLNYGGENPATFVQWPKVDDGLHIEERYIEPADLRLIIETAQRLEVEGWTDYQGLHYQVRPGTAAFLTFLATAGTRKSEARRITVGEARREWLSLYRTKGGRARTMPKMPVVERALQTRLAMLPDDIDERALLWHEIGEPFELFPVEWAWTVIMREAGLRYRLHDLRHTALSNFFLKTDLRDGEIMSISGHVSPTILARYSHLRTTKLGERTAAIGADLLMPPVLSA